MANVTAARKTFSGYGRKPRAGVERYPSGQIVHAQRQPKETEADILATAISQPHRRGSADPRSRYHGFSAGRLLMSEQITHPQFRAAERVTTVWIKHAKLVTGSLPRFPSVMADRVAGAIESGLEPADDDIFKLRREFGDTHTALMSRGKHADYVRVITRVCMMDIDPTQDELGDFREAMNLLDKLWKSDSIYADD